jgi:hypothetical protein
MIGNIGADRPAHVCIRRCTNLLWLAIAPVEARDRYRHQQHLKGGVGRLSHLLTRR